MQKNLQRTRHGELLVEPTTLKKFASDYSTVEPWQTISVNPWRACARRTLVCSKHKFANNSGL